jgi:hypothetical protein
LIHVNAPAGDSAINVSNEREVVALAGAPHETGFAFGVGRDGSERGDPR